MDPDAQLLLMGVVTITGLFVIFLSGNIFSVAVYVGAWIIGFFSAIQAAVYFMNRNMVIDNGKKQI